MVRAFNRADLDSVNKWLEARGSKQLSYDELPRHGFIVPNVCVVFLVADGGVGLLECLICNRDVATGVRHEAIRMVIHETIRLARELGVRKLGFLTDHKSVMRYGKDFGFEFHKMYNHFQKEL